MAYQLETLENGVRILTEKIPVIRSAALGLWVTTGSRDEKAAESGAAHFIEHMLFKGTADNTAAQLAGRMDAIGGQLNAFTTKECTCFYVHALDSHLMEGLDILSDMFFNSNFDEEDVKTERGVVLEEIGMYRDDPADVCNERLSEAVFKGTSLARPILGKKATLERMTGQWLKEYMHSHYRPDRVIISLAGSYDEGVVEEIRRRFSRMEPGKSPRTKKASYTPAITLKRKATEQNQLILAFPSITAGENKRFGMQLLSSILGGGMSSRLFQEVREKQGLCYSIYTYGSSYADVGLFCIATAQSHETEEQAISSIRRVIDEFLTDGASQEELDRARELSKANVLMGLESTTAHMNHMARSIIQSGSILSPEEIIAAYDAVTLEELRTLARETFRWDQASLSVVGKVAPEENYVRLIR
ncbi:MAG: insulinase family protein [Oscillospiraceae bacterium]|nr:insulinase family protein [Oscillospiraceae bacterium]